MHPVLQRMVHAMTTHDLETLVHCYTEDYHADLPLHPLRSFTGREHVRSNWRGLLAHVPDLSAEVTRFVADGNEIWSEWEIRGSTRDGGTFLSRGVVVMWIEGDLVASSRFYLDNVDTAAPAT